MTLLDIAFFGNSNVGKTSITLRIYSNTFDEKQKATIGMDYYFKDILHDGEKYKLRIYDTAGSERFAVSPIITKTVFKKINGIIIVVDSSIGNCEEIKKQIKKWMKFSIENSYPKEVPVVIFFNKIDIYELDNEFIKKVIFDNKKDHPPFYKVSALTGQNINESLTEFISQLKVKGGKNIEVVDLTTPKKTWKEKCC